MGNNKTLILGIETSCDETAAAVVAGGQDILSNIILSQVELHSRFGGVVPEIASRQHLATINSIINNALSEAGVSFQDLDALAVSHGPGLVGALLVGVSTAKALAYGLKKPLIAVNHLQAHLYANYLGGAPRVYPTVVLIVSGGHTELLLIPGPKEISPLGSTRDDAAGEAYDKVARVLDLGYPGGPIIDKLARDGNPSAIKFPRSWLAEDGRFDFSFSGLKTAVINHLYHSRRKDEVVNVPDLAASFQEALLEVLIEKTLLAAKEHRAKAIFLAGGVASNSRLREWMRERLEAVLPATSLHIPEPALCTDNAAMIAAAACPLFHEGQFAPLNLNAQPGLPVR